MTDSLLFQIQMSEHNSLPCGGELHDTSFPHAFSANFPPHYHTILVISCVHAGSLICNKHDKLMVKMTILFLL